MKKLTSVAVLSLLVVVCIACLGCGGSGTTTDDTDDGTVTPPSGGIDVLGTYTVRGTSADTYHITPYPDNTYVMTYKGTPSRGTYTVSGTTMVLKPETGSSITLEIKDGGDVLEQASPDVITWKKITAE